jgi:hypothetical protein
MKFFYLSTKCNSQDEFEIHDRECPNLPPILDRDYLGPFNNGLEALRKALKVNKKSCLCEECCSSRSKILISR